MASYGAPLEVALQVLKALAFIRPEPASREKAYFWAACLDADLDSATGVRIVQEIYATKTDSYPILPGHINEAFGRIKRERIDRTPMPDPPDGLPDAAYDAWHRAAHKAIMLGANTTSAYHQAQAAIQQATTKPLTAKATP